MTDKPFRWGILGLGNIARKFAASLPFVPGATLAAVGSRSQDKAEAFGAEFSAPRRYGSYAALAEDPDIDAIYVATPHPMHAEDTLLCLRGGKAVLCEKPFAINAKQAEAMIGEARGRKLFLMDAMWSRFLPVMVRLKQLIDDGSIGDPRMLQADFGFRATFDANSRLFNPQLGGGALLDVGIYPVALSSRLFGAPSDIKGAARLGATGVDEEAAMVLTHSEGRMSLLATALTANTPCEIHVTGTTGSIYVPKRGWTSQTLTVTRNGQDEVIACPFEGNGFQFEAIEVQRCIREGLSESPVMPLDETLRIMQTMDALRSQWGQKYPME
jgi:predicted dehydrogenase